MAVVEASAPISAAARRDSLLKRVKDSRTAWLYIFPAGLVMFVISLLPQIYQVWMSFTDYRINHLRFVLFKPETWERYAPPFVGLNNYVRIVTNDLAIQNYDFWRLLLFNVTWTVVNVAFHVGLGVLIALVLNNKDLIGKRIYRALFVLPWAIPGYITALTWRNMYDYRFGAFNLLLSEVNSFLGTNLPTDTRWLEMTTTAAAIAAPKMTTTTASTITPTINVGSQSTTRMPTRRQKRAEPRLKAAPNDILPVASASSAPAIRPPFAITPITAKMIPRRANTQISAAATTHLQCTPSMARMLTLDPASRDSLGGVPNLYVGGEALPPDLARELQQVVGGTVTNMYGPTETTIWSSSWQLRPGLDWVPIGTPVANTQLYVLDGQQQPVPPGATGHLWIGGHGVVRLSLITI